MSFKVVINDKYIMLEGTKIDMLAGLGAYINALKKNGVSNEHIQEVVELVLQDQEKEFETVPVSNKIKSLNLKNATKEEAKNLIAKEILKMLDLEK